MCLYLCQTWLENEWHLSHRSFFGTKKSMFMFSLTILRYCRTVEAWLLKLASWSHSLYKENILFMTTQNFVQLRIQTQFAGIFSGIVRLYWLKWSYIVTHAFSIVISFTVGWFKCCWIKLILHDSVYLLSDKVDPSWFSLLWAVRTNWSLIHRVFRKVIIQTLSFPKPSSNGIGKKYFVVYARREIPSVVELFLFCLFV